MLVLLIMTVSRVFQEPAAGDPGVEIIRFGAGVGPEG